ncbi:MAG TPA: hypothetical protein DCQ06_05135 [Myxococcales bacterium]|nr:hypothetical protein [Myxococcales bacterium]HAN30961.1 hypothetical protein [Myxococcales bacterium]
MNQRRRYVVAVLGATGAVGRELVEAIDRMRFPVSELRVLASEDSIGAEITHGKRQVVCEALVEEQLRGVDLVLCALPGPVAAVWVPKARAAGATVIDTSSWCSKRSETPLVVPDVNPEQLATMPSIVASPTAVSVAVSRAIRPVLATCGEVVTSAVVSALLPASHVGHGALEELHQQSTALLNFRPVDVERLPARLAFNCVPQSSDGTANSSTDERRIESELERLLNISVDCQAVLVPVFVGASVFVHLTLNQQLSRDQVVTALQQAHGVRLHLDDAPTPSDLGEEDVIEIGKLRLTDHSCQLWVTIDNLRSGSAVNMLRLAQLLDLAWSTARA